MFWRRRRHLITFLMFLGLANIYMLRVNLNVGIVAMNSPYNVTLSNGTVVEKQDFNWNSKMQGVALSSFFYGYSCTQLLAGWLATRFGGKIVFGLGVFVTALMTMVTPLAANTSFYLLVAVRIIEGVFEITLEIQFTTTAIGEGVKWLQGKPYLYRAKIYGLSRGISQ
ncbi:hypothetical protein J6590_061236 [Homalodisca vitripennis]|nr:hypothetical protein J6590_061236 [Homalodisca vitripennis]